MQAGKPQVFTCKTNRIRKKAETQQCLRFFYKNFIKPMDLFFAVFDNTQNNLSVIFSIVLFAPLYVDSKVGIGICIGIVAFCASSIGVKIDCIF